MENVISVAILAAGLGTRMKSRKAKVLHRAGGLTLVEHVVRAASRITSPERIIVVVGHQADEVREVLQGSGVGFVTQTEQRGTGHGLLACREALEPFGGHVIALYGDAPLLSPETLRELIQRQGTGDSAATLVTTVLDDPTGYGRVIRNPRGDVSDVVEQRAASPAELAVREINSGVYCFRADLLWPHLASLEPNPASGEIYLTDIVKAFNGASLRVVPMTVQDPVESLGINTRVELAMVDRILRDRKARELMLSGVTIEKPETVTIDAEADVGADTVVEPFAQILGRTRIGRDCHIGAASILRDSVLGDNVQVGPFTMIGASRVDDGATIGPYARLRHDNHIAAGASVGNFVELKNTRLGARSKALHLAYLGDSQIGENVNVGAGAITCNYDGRRKHRTIIGDGVFVGTNATLVAPLEIGDSSYIAAGSVITEPVPGDTLALGRAKQVLKPGWPSKRREE